MFIFKVLLVLLHGIFKTFSKDGTQIKSSCFNPLHTCLGCLLTSATNKDESMSINKHVHRRPIFMCTTGNNGTGEGADGVNRVSLCSTAGYVLPPWFWSMSAINTTVPPAMYPVDDIISPHGTLMDPSPSWCLCFFLVKWWAGSWGDGGDERVTAKKQPWCFVNVGEVHSGSPSSPDRD